MLVKRILFGYFTHYLVATGLELASPPFVTVKCDWGLSCVKERTRGWCKRCIRAGPWFKVGPAVDGSKSEGCSTEHPKGKREQKRWLQHRSGDDSRRRSRVSHRGQTGSGADTATINRAGLADGSMSAGESSTGLRTGWQYGPGPITMKGTLGAGQPETKRRQQGSFWKGSRR